MLKLPKRMKKRLIDKNISFRKWCEIHGFNHNTAFAVATGVIPARKKGTKSYQIKQKLIEEGLLEN
ncbi:hypothetical protein [Persephonella sp.]